VPDRPPIEVIAMHGWAGDAANWQPWQAATASLGWRWQCGERGYGGRPAAVPAWRGEGRRLLIAHSLGPHLLSGEVLRGAEAVVLLASFARFLVPGREARRLDTALAGMAARLDDPATPEGEPEAAARAQAMLRSFLVRAAAPEPVALLPAGPADAPLGREERQRLRGDLQLLRGTRGLPAGFPGAAAVLLVEAEEDRIVSPAARAELRAALPQAGVRRLEGAGHCLLGDSVIPLVIDWIRNRAWR
jgi:pimeloyl-[acyl-carrier protein] methyl ester esterase